MDAEIVDQINFRLRSLNFIWKYFDWDL